MNRWRWRRPRPSCSASATTASPCAGTSSARRIGRRGACAPRGRRTPAVHERRVRARRSVFVTGGADKTLQVWSILAKISHGGFVAQSRTPPRGASSASASKRSGVRRRAEGKDRGSIGFASRASSGARTVSPSRCCGSPGTSATVTCGAFGATRRARRARRAGRWNHAVMLWNLETGTRGDPGRAPGPVVDVSYSKDTRCILSASADPAPRACGARPDGRGCAQREPRARLGGARSRAGSASRLLAGRRHRRGVGVPSGSDDAEASSATRMGQIAAPRTCLTPGHTLSELSDAESESKRSELELGRDLRIARDSAERAATTQPSVERPAHKCAVDPAGAPRAARASPTACTSRSAMRAHATGSEMAAGARPRPRRLSRSAGRADAVRRPRRSPPPGPARAEAASDRRGTTASRPRLGGARARRRRRPSSSGTSVTGVERVAFARVRGARRAARRRGSALSGDSAAASRDGDGHATSRRRRRSPRTSRRVVRGVRRRDRHGRAGRRRRRRRGVVARARPLAQASNAVRDRGSASARRAQWQRPRRRRPTSRSSLSATTRSGRSAWAPARSRSCVRALATRRNPGAASSTRCRRRRRAGARAAIERGVGRSRAPRRRTWRARRRARSARLRGRDARVAGHAPAARRDDVGGTAPPRPLRASDAAAPLDLGRCVGARDFARVASSPGAGLPAALPASDGVRSRREAGGDVVASTRPAARAARGGHGKRSSATARLRARSAKARPRLAHGACRAPGIRAPPAIPPAAGTATGRGRCGRDAAARA